jgi:Uma2 family endonuclease
MVAPLKVPPATADDLQASANADRLELVAGALIEKAAPSPSHSFAEAKIVEAVHLFNRRPGGRGPGGWWIFTEIHVGYAGGEIYCHDVAGWRRERLATRPAAWPVRERPDWVCEIISPRHEASDLVVKPRTLHAAEVPHYWVVDPEAQLLLVHRWSPAGYVVIQRAVAGETLRAEPFADVELHVGMLFGDDPLD